MDQSEFATKFWDLIDDILEDYYTMEIVGMLSYIKENWMHQFFQVMDMYATENEGETMFQ